jgi:hypothetical protein
MRRSHSYAGETVIHIGALKRSFSILVVLVISACVSAVSATWEWKAKDSNDLLSRGKRVTELIEGMHYSPENTASRFDDSYTAGGRGFISDQSNRIRVRITLNSQQRKLKIEISESNIEELSQVGYEHYIVLLKALNTEFGANNLVHKIYRGFEPPSGH